MEKIITLNFQGDPLPSNITKDQYEGWPKGLIILIKSHFTIARNLLWHLEDGIYDYHNDIFRLQISIQRFRQGWRRNHVSCLVNTVITWHIVLGVKSILMWCEKYTYVV